MASDDFPTKRASYYTSSPTSSVEWYVGVLLVVIGFGFVIGMSVCIYRWQKRRMSTIDVASTCGGRRAELALQGISVVTSARNPVSVTSVSQQPSSSDSPTSRMRIMPPEVFKSAVTARLPTIATAKSLRRPEEGVTSGNSPGKHSTKATTDWNENACCDANLNVIGTKSGTLEFSIGYDRQSLALSVAVIGAKNLMTTGCTNKSRSVDPYVKLQLLPDRYFKAKTRIAKRTLDPVFDETFTFYGMNYEGISNVSIHMAVLGFDRFSRDDVIGDVVFPLHKLDLDGKTLTFVRTLNRRDHVGDQNQNRGELLVSLCHQPLEGKLTVTILKGRNLPKINVTGLADPYVKVYMTLGGQRIAKKRTRIVKCTLNPIFNESFVFNLVRDQSLRDTHLEFFVLDWDRVTKNEVLGRLRLGLDAQADGSTEWKYWEDLIQAPQRKVAVWLKLRG